MKIRPMTMTDVPIVHKFGINEPNFRAGKNCFWPLSTIERMVDSVHDIMLVAEEKDEIIGFLIAAFHTPTRKIHWENLWVKIDFRGHGVGINLARQMLDRSRTRKAVFVSAIVLNQEVDKLMKKLRFQNIGNWYFTPLPRP